MGCKEMFVFFLSLGLGYVLCILARKEKSVLKTLGYTLGIAIIVMTFLCSLVASQAYYSWKGKPCMAGKMMKCMPMMKHHR